MLVTVSRQPINLQVSAPSIGIGPDGVVRILPKAHSVDLMDLELYRAGHNRFQSFVGGWCGCNNRTLGHRGFKLKGGAGGPGSPSSIIICRMTQASWSGPCAPIANTYRPASTSEASLAPEMMESSRSTLPLFFRRLSPKSHSTLSRSSMHSLALDLSLAQAELDDQIGFHFNFLESYEIKLRGMKQWVEGRVLPVVGR